MAIYFGLALGLLIGGLVVCALSPHAGNPLLTRVFWWLGILCAVCGALMLLAPIIEWLSAQVQSALGVRR